MHTCQQGCMSTWDVSMISAFKMLTGEREGDAKHFSRLSVLEDVWVALGDMVDLVTCCT